MVSYGSKVVVVKGVKVPKGTTGEVFWTGTTKYGPRVGFKDANGVVFWTALGNVNVVVRDTVGVPENDAAVAALDSPAVVNAVKATAFDALVARVAALEAALAGLAGVVALAAPGAPAPSLFDPAAYDYAEAA